MSWKAHLSIGVLKTLEDKIEGTILIRSLIESGKEYVEETLTSLAKLTGATVEFSGSYPGWKPVNDTAILALMKKHYAEVLGKEPEIKVIHAGLECGLLKEHYPNIEMISVGQLFAMHIRLMKKSKFQQYKRTGNYSLKS